MNWQRSGLRSTSGVLSRQSRPLTRKIAPSRLTSVASAVPIGFGRTGERSENVPRVAPSLAGLWRTRSRRELVQPIEDLDPLVGLDPVQRRDPGFGDLDAADRPVGSPLARTIEPRRPGRADDADEREPGVERRGRFDRDFVTPDFVQSHHGPTRSCLTPPRSRATLFRPPCRSSSSTETRHASWASRT